MILRLIAASALIAFVTVASAQGSGEGRGTVPLGTAADGSRPAEGAITGGSIQPGESSGIPRDAERLNRCQELAGTLREDCLRKERNSGAGATQPREILPPPPLKSDQPPR